MLEPELKKAAEEIGDLAKDIDDQVLYAIYPVTGKKFLKWKYGVEAPPKDVLPRTMEDVKKQDELIKKAKAGLLVEKEAEKEVPEKGDATRKFNVFVDGDYFEVEVDEPGGAPVIAYQAPVDAPQARRTRPPHRRLSAPKAPVAPKPAPPAAPAAPAKPASAAPKAAAAPASAAADVSGTPLTSPMPGMVVSYAKKVGDAVKKGDTVVILEAMKMENALPAPCDGTVNAINFSSGDSVAKGAVLCVIG